jgi:tetratricopeptide (TPR) repeat protein
MDKKKSTYGLKPEQLNRLLSIGSKDSSEKTKIPEPAGSAPQIEGYEILSKLGEAGQGQIWRALQVSTNRQVALKVPRAGLISSDKALARFEREVELAAALKHPNIAQIHDSDIHQGIYYYAMDLIEGMHLDKYVKQHNLTIRKILDLMKTICRAVQHAHQNGVIHRDLKPSNIIVTENGEPFIVDFGLAKNLFLDETTVTVSIDGEAAGTPAYMSPEQAAGHIDKLDTRTDVYSLGVILFTLLTDESPHDLSGPYYEVMRRIAEEPVMRPRKVCPQVDKELELLLLKALDTDPDGRYTAAGMMAQDIDNYLTGAPLIAGPESGVYHIRKFIKRHQTLVAGITVVLVILVVGVIISTLFAIGQARARSEAQAVTDFLINEILASTNPFTDAGPEVTVLSLLDAASKRSEDKFDDRPLVEAPIRHALGQAYFRHGKYKEAETHLEQALRIYQEELGVQESKTLESMFLSGLVSRGLGRDELAQSFYYKTLEGLHRIGGEKDELAFGALNELARLGIEQYRRGTHEKACATLSSVVKFHRKFGADIHVSVIAFLAMTLYQLDREQEAQDFFNQLLELLEGRGSAVADFILATPTILSATINSSANDSFPCISPNGLSLYFASSRTVGLGELDLYVATREEKSDDWGKPINLGPKINSSYAELFSCISPDGLSFYFNSDRPGSYSGWWDAWVVTRATIEDDWSEPVNLGPTINGPGGAGVTKISANGLSLLFGSWDDRPGGYGSCDGWLVTRATIHDDWEEPVNLGPPINSSASEHCTGVSDDGLIMFFSSGCLGPARPDGAGGGDLWISTRSGKDESWGEPMNLGPTVNTFTDELGPNISSDGSTLYFCAGRPGGFGSFDLWQVSLVPIVDTNGNGKIDVVDLCNLAQTEAVEE